MTKSPYSGRNTEVVARYDYTDEAGKLHFQANRYEPGFHGEKKTFRQRRPDGGGGWIDNLDGVRLVPYRLPELAKASNIRPVYVVEGEKDVETLRGQELLATTNPMGAGKWRDEFSEALRDRHVFILPDNDKIGRDHAEKVKQSLTGVAASVAIVELPGLPEKGDVTDWFASPGNNKKKLLEIIKMASGQSAARSKPPKPKTAPDPYRPFPVEALPEPIRSYVIQGAASIGCDPAYFALPALSAAAALIGTARTIRIKRDWYEPSVVWTGIVGDSGTLKTPAVSAAVAPVYRLQRSLLQKHKGDLGEYEREKAAFEERKKKARNADKEFTEQAPEKPTPARRDRRHNHRMPCRTAGRQPQGPVGVPR